MALLAFAPLALVRADACPPALLASAPLALVRAVARAPALLAIAPSALVRAHEPLPRVSTPDSLSPTPTVSPVIGRLWKVFAGGVSEAARGNITPPSSSPPEASMMLNGEAKKTIACFCA